MRVLVTGARGKVGRAAVAALLRAGHQVVATDLGEPDFDTPPAGTAPYVKTDLTDAGQVYALVGGASVGEGPRPGPFEAVVHAGAIPAPGRHAPHVVFTNNLSATFNVVEACVRLGVRRLVNISSETVPGFIFAERPFLPEYLPVDEAHPVRPQDPYALAKLFGEQLCDAAVQRSELRCISIRPTWVQNADTYHRNLGPFLTDRAKASVTGWSYIDADDLAEAIRLAVESELPGHEVIYIAAEDTIGGRHLYDAWQEAYPQSRTEFRPVSRPDAAGIDTTRARNLLGWRPMRTWRDYLDDDGQPRTAS
ncbi:MAG: epimerase [Actinobacteria bacterium 13_1_20CM_3_71_11]|nr:MAG: epimerase [Actinobacteria bacterium 13_1_20CM_3_71_11]